MALEVRSLSEGPWVPEPEDPKKFKLTNEGLAALGTSLTFLAYFINGIIDW